MTMTITITDLIPFLPTLVTLGTAVLVMLAIAIYRNHTVTATLTLTGLAVALYLNIGLWDEKPAEFTGLILIDQFELFFAGLILAVTMGCVLLCYPYINGSRDNREELYLLLLCACSGALVLVSAQHMTSLFIGLELLSIPLFGMVGYLFRERNSLEACIKYVVLSAVASAMLLFGMALLYADAGTLSYEGLAQHVQSGKASAMLLLAGFGLVIIGLGFKLSLVPFHMWTPDVYGGAPAPVGAFLATVSKLAVFAVLLRLWISLPIRQAGFPEVLAALAAASILVGNLLALQQNNLKRILGYSSIAHVGYLLVVILAYNELSMETVVVYSITYAAASLGCFAVLSLVSTQREKAERATLSELKGLYWQRPWMAGAMVVMLLSLAGVPLTAGFIGKFYVLSTTLSSGLWWLLVTVVLGSVIGVYYYLRAMLTLFAKTDVVVEHACTPSTALAGLFTVGLAAFVLAVGVYPQPLLDILK